MDLNKLSEVVNVSDCIWSEDRLTPVYDRMAGEIESEMSGLNPLVLCVMNGGLFLTSELMKRMQMLQELDYVHATRYQGETEGGEMNWIRFPVERIAGRNILIIDDILDIGITLKSIQQACHEANAASVRTAVLTVKQHDRQIPDVDAEYIGVEVPDRYVYGCGMDYHGYHRNLPHIYALKEDA